MVVVDVERELIQTDSFIAFRLFMASLVAVSAGAFEAYGFVWLRALISVVKARASMLAIAAGTSRTASVGEIVFYGLVLDQRGRLKCSVCGRFVTGLVRPERWASI